MAELPMTHAGLQKAVTDLAVAYGIKWHHETDSRKSKRGWPDLVLSGRHGTIFRELKVPPDEVRPEQQEWLDRLAESGLDSGVWWPADWRSGRVRLELLAIR